MARPKKLETRPSTITSERSGRPRRVPINGQRNILSVEGQDPNFHYCFVYESEVKNNVPRYRRAGYEFVTHDCIVGDVSVGKTHGLDNGRITIPAGGADRGLLVLMRLPKEDFDGDMATLEIETDARENAMKRNITSKKDDGMYGGELKMSSKLGDITEGAK